MKADKILQAVLSGRNDHSIRFDDLRYLLDYLGFDLNRITGSHHIYSYKNIAELIDLQPDKKDHSKAKSYQVKQVRAFIKNYSEVLK